MSKPWSREFPNDRAADMDDAAVEILIANMNAGRTKPLCAGRHRFGGEVGICEGTTDNETGYCDACEYALDM